MQGGISTPHQTFAEHFRELRLRLTYVFVALLAGSVVGYMLHKQILHILAAPLKQQLYYTSPLGGFNAIMKISILFGLILAIPLAIYHFIKFMMPALQPRMKLRPLRFVVASFILAGMGVAAAYFFSLPAALHFLSKVSGSELTPFIVVNDYLNFVLAYLVGFALLFQIPLIMLFINKIKPQQPKKLMANQRWVLLVSFVLAAVLTPTPDPLNQTLMAAPMIVLYQVGVSAVWAQNRKHRKHSLPTKAQPLPVPTPPTEETMPQTFSQQPVQALQARPNPRYFDIIPPKKPAHSIQASFQAPGSVTAPQRTTFQNYQY